MNKLILRIAVIFFLVSVIFIFSCKKDKEVTTGNIEGTITDAVTLQPVNGATVTLSPNNNTVVTSNDGKYSFSYVEKGDYTIHTSKTGYQTNTKDVTVLSGQTRKGDIAITPNIPILNVNITSLDFGSTITTLPIEIRNIGAASLDWTITENIAWLSINLISGNTTTQVSSINITVDRTGLSQGNYTQSFSITSNGGSAIILVNMNIATPNSPTVTCATPINVTQNTSEVFGNITSIGSSNVTQKGHCWSTNPNPSTSDNITTLGPTSVTGSYMSQLSGLMPNTTYYIRAYATNNSGTGYSPDQMFTTTGPPNIPSLTTNIATNITQTTADIAGEISSLGSGGITQHGHCWSIYANPTINNSKTTLGSTSITGSFTSHLTNLVPNTTYYVRTYATNSAGTGYSSEVSFTTTMYTIGSSYQGGKLAYVLQFGDPGYIAGEYHGLIAAPSDQSTGIQWYNGSFIITGATGTVLGSGNANTNLIVSSQGAGSYAAKLCSDLVLGGYNDWYLPSLDELNKLYLNQTLIGGFSIVYWTSNEYDAYSAWYQTFNTGTQNYFSNKQLLYNVRAVRSF